MNVSGSRHTPGIAVQHLGIPVDIAMYLSLLLAIVSQAMLCMTSSDISDLDSGLTDRMALAKEYTAARMRAAVFRVGSGAGDYQ